MIGEKYSISFTLTEIAGVFEERFLITFEYFETDPNYSQKYCYEVVVDENMVCLLVNQGENIILNPAPL